MPCAAATSIDSAPSLPNTTASTERTQQVVISVNKPDGDTSSFLTPQRLQEHLELLQIINDMKVSVQGFEFTLQDLCHKVSTTLCFACLGCVACFLGLTVVALGGWCVSQVNAPNGFGGASALIPCTRVTVLDCFSQGGFDFPAVQVTRRMQSSAHSDSSVPLPAAAA